MDNSRAKPPAKPGRITKAMLQYLKIKSSFNRIATDGFQWLIREGATDERQFSTYSMGM
jgi:hypothetical protein